MKIKQLIFWMIAIAIGFVAMWYALPAEATAVKVDVCHHDGQSGNFQTINIAEAGVPAHVPAHDKDYLGRCEVEVTPTVILSVTPVPDPTPTEVIDIETPTAGVSATIAPTQDPKGPPEWENPCFYLRDNPECKTKEEILDINNVGDTI